MWCIKVRMTLIMPWCNDVLTVIRKENDCGIQWRKYQRSCALDYNDKHYTEIRAYDNLWPGILTSATKTTVSPHGVVLSYQRCALKFISHARIIRIIKESRTKALKGLMLSVVFDFAKTANSIPIYSQHTDRLILRTLKCSFAGCIV